MGRPVDIQTADQKNQKKIKSSSMTYLGLAESFKTVNRPGLTQPNPVVTLFDGLFLRNYVR